MQVLITSTRIELVQQGSVLPLIGADMLSAKYEESTVKQPVIGDGDLSIFIRLEYQEELVEIPLRSVSNQPRWTNNPEGAQQALLDILPVMRSPNLSGSGGIFQLTGSVLAGPGAGSVPSTLSPTGVVPGSYNNPVVIVNAEGRITSIVSAPPTGGDVNGPGSAGDENIVLFNGTSGKNIKDSGITLAQVVATDGNPSGVSPISSGSGVWPIELRRFTDSLAIKAQANTGSVSFALMFSALNKVFIGDAMGDPVEADVATTSTANAIVRALATGKIDTSFLPDSILGQLEYQGSWDAATNTPAIPAASSANKGWYYIASTAVASSHSYPNVPAVDFAIGDWLVSNGTSWDKIDNTDAVPSVFGRVGAIVAAFGDYSSTLISNLSVVAGASVTDALNALNTLVAAKQDFDADLAAIAALTGTGLYERTGPGSGAIRPIGAASATDILSRGDADGRYLQSAGPLWFYIPPTGSYVLPVPVSGTLSTQTGLANRLDLFPFSPARNITIDQLAIEVTSGVAGALMRIGIWNDNAGNPGSLVVGTGDLDGSSNGVKTGNIAATTLVAGSVYWTGVLYSSNNIVRAIPVTMTIPIAYPAAGGTALSNARRATHTYGLGLPDPAPAGSVNSLTWAAIMMRID